MNQAYSFKLSPIELSYMQVLESAKKGLTPRQIVSRIRYAVYRPNLSAQILDRFLAMGMVLKKDDLYYLKKSGGSYVESITAN